MAMAAAAKTVLVPVGTGTEEMEAVITIDVLRRAGAAVTVASVESTAEVLCSRGIRLVADKLIEECASETYDLIACPVRRSGAWLQMLVPLASPLGLSSSRLTRMFHSSCSQGGMPGAERLRDSEVLTSLVKAQRDSGRLYAAICATPAVFFEAKGLLEGKKATCHPGFTSKLSDQRYVAVAVGLSLTLLFALRTCADVVYAALGRSSIESRVVEDGTLTTSRGPGTAFEFSLSLVRQLYGEEVAKSVAAPMVM
jgi:protein deglycase